MAGLETGRAHGEQPLSLLFRLAEVLAVDAADLLVPTASLATSVVDADLVAKVGGVLFELRHLTSPEILAAALNVTTDEVGAAVVTLDQRVAALGLRVHRLRGDVGVVRSQTTPSREELRAAWQQDFARRSMTLGQARMLYRVWRGGFEQKQLSNPERVTLAQLVNAGPRRGACRSRGKRGGALSGRTRIAVNGRTQGAACHLVARRQEVAVQGRANCNQVGDADDQEDEDLLLAIADPAWELR